jgi:hypothetical protein
MVQNLDFQLKSITYPNDTTIHHLKIATLSNNIYFINPHTITGTWGGGTDVHPMTGHITDDYKLICSWSSKPNMPPDHFISDGTLTWVSLTWKLHGTVKDANGNPVGPKEVSGLAV